MSVFALLVTTSLTLNRAARGGVAKTMLAHWLNRNFAALAQCFKAALLKKAPVPISRREMAIAKTSFGNVKPAIQVLKPGSSDLADSSNPDVRALMEAKHPVGLEVAIPPDLPSAQKAGLTHKKLRDLIRRSRRGSSPGPSRLTFEKKQSTLLLTKHN